ncbi:AAA family ATPase, partial [Rubrivirga sp.]|uniref:AAA family ATPase n=1 Tax=Rubrivirga sp. TaxID=1885344 RepID=UPI003C7321A9
PEGVRDLHAQLSGLQDEAGPLVHAEVGQRVVAEVIADWTGIPIGDMVKDEAQMLLELEERLTSRIRGQDNALTEISDAIRTSKAGMRKQDAPLGVFLLAGPSGVGKTETARALAELLFGGERFLVSINMSEYQESHTTSQLKGSPPGYVGYGEGGVLTEAVRQRPYSVVLLDEVEKAHIDVMEMFYQVFDRGILRDGEGREVDFTNTIILCTSNVGSALVQQASMAEEAPSLDELRSLIHEPLANHFQPALLGRMNVVPFLSLDREAMGAIARLKLNKVNKRLQENHGIQFVYPDAVVEEIADRCTTIDAGARNIDAIIDRTVLPNASRALLARLADENMPAALELGIDEAGDFTYTFHDSLADLDARGDGAPAVEAEAPTDKEVPAGDGTLEAEAPVLEDEDAEEEPGNTDPSA